MIICLKSFFTSIAFVFLFVLGIVLLLYVFNKGPLGGINSFVVLTGSMNPAISEGSITYVKKDTDYRVGDIITFNSLSGSRVTHRIADTDAAGYVTRGDANKTTDTEVVSKGQIIGRSIFTIPYVGGIVLFFKSPMGLGMLVLGVGLLLSLGLLSEIRKIKFLGKKLDMKIKTELNK